jgi:zinc and cadmium transporter
MLTVSVASVGTPAFPSLAVYLVCIAAAAFAGGSSVAFLSLGHRTMQVLLSLTGGVLLGVGLLHLLPHAHVELGGNIETTMGWVLAGFFLMFLLERAFHGHSHHTADGEHECGHGHAHCDPHAEHRPADHAHPGPGQPASPAGPGRWAWCGAFAGLALHSLADGAALAASVRADAEHGGGLLAGFAAFLAILLHKPFDSGIIAALMIGAGASPRLRLVVNLAYAAIVPLGAIGLLTTLQFLGPRQDVVLGIAMAMAAGAFLCIAAADLLPEVQFHSHDRVLLTASLALGLAIAWGITVLERNSHAHAAHGGAAQHHH